MGRMVQQGMGVLSKMCQNLDCSLQKVVYGGVGSFFKLFSEQKDANAGLCCKVHRGPKEASIRGPNCEAHIHLKQGAETSHKSKYG